jgi:hypothetical protein
MRHHIAVTMDLGMVGDESIPDSVRPGVAATRTVEWQSTAVAWALEGREWHSNDYTP